ncbi:MAG: hypothetical protein AVDCRST_MAG77-2120 [uncultured Chloroflexi bacterium]|uniref:Uncharacterized protein n=1 Tax=uncultured Chloroflexota bacterium TaxID=166587 RepID=A0A6J4IG25_9CHLR|nr:MAG: hypothetical protein AVDCRST_MAG77-2120 [uncultured Chloroflexota bacterium]
MRRAQRTRPGKRRSGGTGPSRRMYYAFLAVSILVVLTMVVPTCGQP